MRTAIFSIKPVFAGEILAGNKGYEYRRRANFRHDMRVLMYATTPIQRVVGEFKTCSYVVGKPDDVWEYTKDSSGITKEYYDEYFEGCKTAIAIKVSDVVAYEKSKPLSAYGVARAPQNYCYID